MKVPAPSLAPILRSDTQGRILARLMADPMKAYNLSELVEWAGSSMPTVQREVSRAERAGVVTTRKVGPSKLVQANPQHPLYAALSQVVLGTYGPPAVIAHEFRGLRDVTAVILFGSWAARYLGQPGRSPNDIDVLVLGSPEREAVDDAAERAERVIGLPVQPTIRTLSQWDSSQDPFIQELKSRPLVVVLRDDHGASSDERIHNLKDGL